MPAVTQIIDPGTITRTPTGHPSWGVHYSTVTKVWKVYGVRPWRTETFKFSTDPELVTPGMEPVTFSV
jgi:hypothetical protein